jgi:hypothetical protein
MFIVDPFGVSEALGSARMFQVITLLLDSCEQSESFAASNRVKCDAHYAARVRGLRRFLGIQSQ